MATFFHVDRESKLKPGDVLSLLPLPAEPHPSPIAAEAIRDQFPDGLTHHGLGYWWYGQEMFPMLNTFYSAEQVGAMRGVLIELIWETARQAWFRDRPSRFASVFTWRTVEEARRFAPPGVVVWEVEGELRLMADMALLGVADTQAHTIELARRYWSGEATNQPRWECLLAPGARVARAA